MLRINVCLFLLVILTALVVVDAQYQARKLYAALDQQAQLSKRYLTEYDQLQIEQSTWAMHSRLESFAVSQLQMHAPVTAQIRVLMLAPAAPATGVPSPAEQQ